MEGALQTVNPGDPLVITAAGWNDIVRAAQARKASRLGNTGGEAAAEGVTPALTVLVRNDTGSNQSPYPILAVIGSPVDPSARPLEFGARPVFSGHVPAADTDPILIVGGPIANDRVGEAAIAGVAVCNVKLNDTAHVWAKPIAGDATKLDSASSGPVRILWRAMGSAGATVLAVVRLDGQGAANGSDPDADATTRGYVSLNNQTMGDGDKAFQKLVRVNTANGVDNGVGGAKFRVNNGAGASSFRVQPQSWVIGPGSYGYRTDAYLFEDDISRTDPIYIGNLVAYGRARFLSIVGASGQVVDDPLRSEAGALGEDGIFLVNCSGRLSGKPGLVAFRIGSVNPQLSLAFDNDNAIVYPSCSAFLGNARYGIERLGAVIPGIDGTDPLGNVYYGGIITTLGTGIAYSAITGTPSLAAVATSGAYSDLSGTPSLAAVATSGAYSDLSGTPSLAAVATSGAYSDLSGTPSLAAVATSGAYSDLSGVPSLATVATTGAYTDLTGLPALAAIATSGLASDVAYTPANSADWAGDPTTVGSAIDRLAAAVAGLLGGPIP